ncbi:hypothetical protein Sjap_006747 [Stephania japonica]|uniref:Uncharacterized protein n=1 Tax=Stephania japonica TaxID=461633 RepID=A0AAP0PLC4_9MAGN
MPLCGHRFVLHSRSKTISQTHKLSKLYSINKNLHITNQPWDLYIDTTTY